MELYKYLDHTLLNTCASREEIFSLCREAVRHKTASVCIPPCYVAEVRREFPALTICTVIGFPNGYQTTAAKVFETRDAIENGADEIDMVINRCMVKNGDFDGITEEIRAVKAECGDRLLKVIIETCELCREEKLRLCRCVTDAGADFIKTSTGFGAGGATLEDVALLKENVGEGVRVKAAGGVSRAEDIRAFVAAGAARIGTSKGVRLLEREEKE